VKIYFIYSTFKDLKSAKLLAFKLLKNNFAACTNIIPTIYSTHVWKNKTYTDKECSMIIKTTKSKVKKAIKFIKANHSYECPAITAFPISNTHKAFQKWVIDQTK